MRQLGSLVLIAFLGGCTQIDTGNVGVERTLGNVKQQTLGPGVYFSMFKTVDEFTAKEIPLQIQNLRPKSRDNLTMTDVDLDVYFKVNPGKMAVLFTKYQGDVSRVMKPHEDGSFRETGDEVVGMGRVLREAREAVYRAVATFDATTMHLKRDEIANAVRDVLQRELNKTDPECFEITNINVRSLVTDPALESAIRDRAKVDQEIEAKRKQGELAKVEAERRQIEAEGEARANRIIADSLTSTLMRAREIEAMAKFAGSGTHTVILPSGVQPLVQVK